MVIDPLNNLQLHWLILGMEICRFFGRKLQ